MLFPAIAMTADHEKWVTTSALKRIMHRDDLGGLCPASSM